MKPTRLALAALVAVAVTATLSGCLQWFLPPAPSTTSQPTGEQRGHGEGADEGEGQAFHVRPIGWRYRAPR